MSTNLCDYNSLVYAAKISCSYCIVYKMLKPLKNDVSSFIYLVNCARLHVGL